MIRKTLMVAIVSIMFISHSELIVSLALADVILGTGNSVSSGVVNGTFTNYHIADSLGSRAGNNLFHSFRTFNIDTGESATFTGPAGIANIISRVTGGTASSIDGLIRSTIDGANLYLLNPSGIMFGPNASLDLQGSFHVSTANYLKFSDGKTFFVDPLANSVLSAATPEAFGFLSAQPAGIQLDRSVLQVPVGQTISLIGGGITAQNETSTINYFDPDNFAYGPNYYLLTAPSGKINIISVASPGEVNLSAQDLGIGSFTALGDISFTHGANLTVASDLGSSGSAGTIVIRGGKIQFQDLGVTDPSVGLFVAGIEASGNPAGIIDIKGTSLEMNNASIGLITVGEGHPTGQACNISLTDKFTMNNGSWIDTSNFNFYGTALDPAITGNSGAITISAKSITLGDENPTASMYAAFGFYGYISSLSAFGGTGTGGDISLTASGDMTIQNGFTVSTAVLADGAGNAGKISANAKSLQILDQGLISSDTFGAGKGGVIEITTQNLLISGEHSALVPNIDQLTGIKVDSAGVANGGSVRITTDVFQLQDGGKISALVAGGGNGADIFISAKDLAISGDKTGRALNSAFLLSAIDSRVLEEATGTGGNVYISSNSLQLDNGAWIDTSTYGGGHSGSIDIQASNIVLGNDTPGSGPGTTMSPTFFGAIESTSKGTGTGGNVTINADSLTLQNGFRISTSGLATGDSGNISISTDSLQCLNRGVLASNAFGSGKGGIIDVTAKDILFSGTDSLLVPGIAHGTGIAAQVDSSAIGGEIIVHADNLTLRNGGIISTILFGTGKGADIDVTAKNISISGYFFDANQTPPYNTAIIDARVYGAAATGQGGNIKVDVDNLSLSDRGSIRSDLYNSASGNSGNVTVKAGTITFNSLGQISADSFRGTGNSGNLDITSQTLSILGIGDPPPGYFTGLSTSTSAGTGGNITVVVNGDLYASSGGGIKAETKGNGTGGTISLAAHNISVTAGALISSSSTGSGNAGNIILTGANSIVLNNSSITTAASVNADGGDITIITPFILKLINSKVTSSVGGGPETSGGNISIDPKFVVLKDSWIVANAFAGTGGNIAIVANNYLADPVSIVDASSQLGISGTVDIQAPIANVSGLLSPLSSDYVSASALLRERCIARIREGGSYSSFVVGGRDGLPMEPGSILPSLMY